MQFVGSYSPVDIYTEEHTKLYLGEANKLYYATKSKNIDAFRAYFQLNNGLTAGDTSNASVRAFVLNFGDDGEVTGIVAQPTLNSQFSILNSEWYDLSGRKLNGKPTTKGLYINNGKKVVIK